VEFQQTIPLGLKEAKVVLVEQAALQLAGTQRKVVDAQAPALILQTGLRIEKILLGNSQVQVMRLA
jgi:hypothetical protein